MSDEERLLIDCMALAEDVFQGCRYVAPESVPLLEVLVRTLPLVKEHGTPHVEVPAAWVRALDASYQGGVLAPPAADPARLERPELVPAIAVVAAELLRLWSVHAFGAISSLGYGFHFVPRLARSGERFDPRQFQFCFRIAAFRWDELSREMQELLCALAEIEPQEAQRKIAQEGFVIDMYGFRDKGRAQMPS